MNFRGKTFRKVFAQFASMYACGIKFVGIMFAVHA